MRPRKLVQVQKVSSEPWAQGSAAWSFSPKMGSKMTGVISYEILGIDLQAQASGLSLLAPDKGPRTEN